MSRALDSDVVPPFRAVVLVIPGTGLDVPAIVDAAGHYVGFLTENGNAELAEAFIRNPSLVGVWTWRDIPEWGHER